MKPLRVPTALVLLLALAACHQPLTPLRPGSLSIQVSAPRSVVANFSSLVSSYFVTLTPLSGGTPRSTTVTTGSASFSAVDTGDWTVSVVARNGNGDTIGRGSSSVTVVSGTPSSVTVTLSTTQNGAGAFSFAFRFPNTDGIDYVSAELFNAAGASVLSGIVPTLTANGGMTSASIAQSAIASGSYRLQLTFARTGSGAMATILSEAINVWDNCLSDQWLQPNGTLGSQRTFALGEFGSSSTALANLVIKDASGTVLQLGPTFMSSTTNYSVFYQGVAGASVTVAPALSMDGQLIEYSLDGSFWTILPNMTASASISVVSGATIRVRVTARDHATKAIYLIAIDAAVYTLTYSANGGSGSPPVDSRRYQSDATVPVAAGSGLSKSASAFYCWNFAADGSGAALLPGYGVVMSTNRTLYAIWISEDLTVVNGEITGYNGTPPSNLIIPEGVTSIGASAFSGESGITQVTLPNSLTSIGSYAFAYCTGLTQVDLPAGLTTIDPGAFLNSGLTSVVIPEGVTTIGDSTFRSSSVTTVTLPSTLTTIGTQAFGSCASLTSVTIPASVTFIGWVSFGSCPLLNTVTFEPGSQLTFIGDSAFAYAYSLTSIQIPASVQTIAVYAFYNCFALASVTIESGSQLNIIDSFAFQGAGALTQLYLPSSVTYLGEAAFRGAGLSTLSLGSGLETIGKNAFGDCHYLPSVNIPASVTSIGDGAFGNGSVLTLVTMNPTTPPAVPNSGGTNPFSGHAGGLQILVPISSLSTYTSDSVWGIHSGILSGF